MNYLEATIKILEEAGRPLSCQQIAAIALERNWVESPNGDFSGILNTLMLQDLKSRGVNSDFSRIGPRTYTLRRMVYKQAQEESDVGQPPIRRASEREPFPQDNDGNRELPPPKQVANRQEWPVERPTIRYGDGYQPNSYAPKKREQYADRPPEARYDGNVQDLPRRPVEHQPERSPDRHERPPERQPERQPERHERPPERYDRPGRSYTSRAVTTVELWELMEVVGTGMGYSILDVVVGNGRTHCMGWHIGGNPEMCYILWIEMEGIDMAADVDALFNMNYHKVLVMAEPNQWHVIQDFLAASPHTGRLDVVFIPTLGEWAKLGIRYMEFYNRLCDYRPLVERGGMILGG